METSEYIKRRLQWSHALTSGDYLQGTGKLKSLDGTYCCLGVACEVFSDDLNIRSREIDTGTFFTIKNEFVADSSQVVLPEPLRKYLGLSRNDQNVLIFLNDSRISFTIIAGVILEMAVAEN